MDNTKGGQTNQAFFIFVLPLLDTVPLWSYRVYTNFWTSFSKLLARSAKHKKPHTLDVWG